MSFSLHDLSLILPEAFLLFAICGVIALDLIVKPTQRDATHWVSIGVLVATLLLVLVDPDPTHERGFSGMFVHDAAAKLLKVFILLVVIAVFVYARTYLKDRKLFVGEFHMLVLFATLGMMLLVSAGSLVMIYVGLELLTLSSYALVALNRDSPLSSEAAMKYFVLGALASGILLYGMSMIYGASGTLDIGHIHGLVSSGVGDNKTLLAFGLVFLVAGIGFKFGAAPFHMWLPDVYQGSPTAVTAFIGSAPKIAAFGMAWRLLDGALGGLHPHWGEMLAVLSVLSLAVGNVVAIAQTNLKRMLAYSTISHVGFLLLGLANGAPSGYAAAMFYAIAYAIMSAAAFGSIQLLARAGFEAEEIDDFKGLNQRNPWYAFVVLLVMASLAGIPPLFGFFAKLMVLKAALDAGQLWLAIVAIVFAIVGMFYYLRVIKVMYFDPPSTKGALALPHDIPLRWVLSINGAALLFLGLFFGPLLAWCYRAMGAG
ncbi:MAG: NADH-quinone oxidoreductase subunit NuoN [Rudaea sp.]|uniref:NADH-quinone oxidoreductase subunit NuoN n=1 Tax=Rudaea sp. TaxID=2136325 RepID=UPI0039E5F814